MPLPKILQSILPQDDTRLELEKELSSLHLALQQCQQNLSLVSQQKQKLEIVLSSLPDGIILVDQNRLIHYLNSAATSMLAFKEEEVLGKATDSLIQFIDSETTLTFLHYCPFKEGGLGVIFSHPGLKAAGKKEVLVNLTTIQNGQFAILVLRDIQKSTDLEKLRFDFVSMAAHELRTPLTSIKGYLSVFLNENKEQLSKDNLQLLNQADEATDQLATLIENLLSVSRIERGVLNVNLESIDWGLFLSDVVGSFQDSAKQKELELAFSLPTTPLPKLKVDKIRMSEVLNNLLSNAIKYTDPGGKIIVSTKLQDKEITTHVQDTGKGIPPEAQAELFNKFFRVSGPMEGGTKGTGLGLYITKSLVEMHHGRIWVTSEVGKGSTFSFSLPI